MLTESKVSAAVCHFLKARGFQITQHLSETQKGIDIVAVTPDGKIRVAIEAKGETSSMEHTPRFGTAFSSSQVFDHVAKAVYCAAIYISKGMLGGIALPKNAPHLNQVEIILPALKRLEIEVFWVLPSGDVEIAGNWTWWADSRTPARG